MDIQNKKQALMLFGESLRKLRGNANLSQEELADRAGIDRSYLGAIERGEHNLALLNILKIANALSIEPYQLLKIFSTKEEE